MKENPENFSENILQNIAEDLSTINGTCTEIKESQLNCATADDLNNMGITITSAVTEKVDEMQTSIETQTQTVSEIGSNLTTSVDALKTEITNKIDNFTANPPVQKIEKDNPYRQGIMASLSRHVHLGVHLHLLRSCHYLAGVAHRTSPYLRHQVSLHPDARRVNSEGLDSIQSWFRDPERVKQIEEEVKDYEDRVQETARALDQKYRLEEKSTT